MYAKLSQGQVLDRARGLWKASYLLKCVFLWQTFHNHLPMFANVAKMHGPTNMACSCAVSWKTRFFFSCHLARFAWSVVHEASGQLWNPASGADLLDILRAQYGSNRRIRWRCVGVLLWALWTVKNKITIELIFKCHPADCIFKCHLSAAVDSAGEMSGR